MRDMILIPRQAMLQVEEIKIIETRNILSFFDSAYLGSKLQWAVCIIDQFLVTIIEGDTIYTTVTYML